MAECSTKPTLNEVDDASVVVVVTDGEIDPVPILIHRDNHLVPGGMHHHRTVTTRCLSIKGVAESRSDLREVDAGFEDC